MTALYFWLLDPVPVPRCVVVVILAILFAVLILALGFAHSIFRDEEDGE